MNNQAMIARGIRESAELLLRYVAGFDDTSHTRSAANLPNHVAWSLGHMSLTMARAGDKIRATPLDPSMFGARSGEPLRMAFDPETVCFGSVPASDRGLYPSLARCVEIFRASCDQLASTVEQASDAALEARIAWGSGATTGWDLSMRMIFHNGNHGGQIADLRRALGMKSIFA